MSEYHPILLIGGLHRIISKILANRMKAVLPTIISPQQIAFLPGRKILDGVVVINELVDWEKRQCKKMLIFKVDFQKAYDSVNWRFLEYMLLHLGFGQKWRRWIKACVCSSRISILVNRSLTQEFEVKRGLKQGDPLAPLLFFVGYLGV